MTLKPQVYIIGAGPGDPELLTLKAHKIITQADVILFADSLIPQQILADTKQNAEIITTADKTLEEIIEIIVKKVKAGLSVARLHSGDLTLYSAIYEQMELLAAADIDFELIPGIGTFQAAAAKIKSELTIPGLVQSIILTRVSGNASPVPEAEDLASLAAHQASLCLYLAARHIETAQKKLLQYYAPDTPVAICFRITWPDEQILLVPLTQMARVSRENNLLRTTLYIISPALKNNLNSQRSSLYDRHHKHIFRLS